MPPAQARKPREAFVGGDEFTALLNRQCGEVGVRNIVASRVYSLAQTCEKTEVIRAWIDSNAVGASQQVITKSYSRRY
ncbi:hypothetical protein BH24DEI2_BH24DEI2_27540 [soil metagenome]